MITEKENVLKGQHTLAQGNALGINAMTKIVRAIMFAKEKFIFRTKGLIVCFPDNYAVQFRPNEIICFVYQILADGFRHRFPFTQGVVSDRSSRNYALGYTILPFQGEEQFRSFK